MARKCFYCEGTGKVKIPKNEKVFDDEFDRLDSTGQFNMHDCREMALRESGYTVEVCQNCKGTGIEPED